MAPAISVATGLYQVLTLPELVQKSFKLDDAPKLASGGRSGDAMQLPGTLEECLPLSIRAAGCRASGEPGQRRRNGALKLLARGSRTRYGWLPSDGDPQGASKSMRDGLSRKRKPKRTRCTGRTGRGTRWDVSLTLEGTLGDQREASSDCARAWLMS